MYKVLIHLLFLLFPCVCFATQPKYEYRAAWLTTVYGLDWPSVKATTPTGIKKQKQELCKILDQLKEANFNTVLFQTRLRSDVIYPSNIEPYSNVLTGTTGKSPGYDPLAFAIEECHKRGMELHAWIVAIPLGTSRQIKSLGTKSIVHKKPSITKLHQGEWYLDPGNPETKEYLFSIIREITTHYDIDGIHLDYIRYPDRPSNFSDKETYAKYGKGKSLAEWRRDNITTIVRHIYQGVKEMKPWVKVSSSPLGKFKDTARYSSQGWNAYHTVYQDAQGWVKEGIQDVLFPMLYFDNNHFYPFVLDWKENCPDRPIVPGLGIYFMHEKEKNWPLEVVERQVNFLRSQELGGQAYYRTQFILENTKGILSKLHNHFYQNPALIPPMEWMNYTAPSAPQQLRQTENDGYLVLSWQPSDTADKPEKSYFYTLYASDDYPVDITNATNIVTSHIKENQYSHLYLYPLQKKKYFALTVSNRYGNESEAAHFSAPTTIPSLFLRNSELNLPEKPEAAYVTITDILGRNVLNAPYDRTISVDKLEKGFYRIFITDHSEKTFSLGTFHK